MPENTPETVKFQVKGYTVVVSSVDVDLLETYKYHVSNPGNGLFYVTRATKRNKKHKVFYLHREIMERVLGRPIEVGLKVDHINGNTLDNTRENLRVATHAQNIHNAKRHRSNTSGYKGVQKHKKGWEAAIRVNGKLIHLGVFTDPAEAHEEYKKAAIAHFGEFARFE